LEYRRSQGSCPDFGTGKLIITFEWIILYFVIEDEIDTLLLLTNKSTISDDGELMMLIMMMLISLFKEWIKWNAFDSVFSPLIVNNEFSHSKTVHKR